MLTFKLSMAVTSCHGLAKLKNCVGVYKKSQELKGCHTKNDLTIQQQAQVDIIKRNTQIKGMPT